jgi:triphosphatase
MPQPQEIELKLDVPPDYARSVERLPLLKGAKPAHIETLRAVYFDTDKLKLRKNGLSLRVRSSDGRYRQTIKQRGARSAGFFDRNEWETETAHRRPDLDAAQRTGLKRLLSKKLRRNLTPMIETRVRRKVFLVRHGGAKIELALDEGSVKAAGKASPLCEVELELKEGEPSELFRLAHDLGDAVPVRLATRSKAGRGYGLIAGESTGPVLAEAVAVSPAADWATAFRVAARACLYQIAGNEAALRDGDAEALHQMRVGVRRLRAVISLFKEMLSGPQTEAVKSELKWLTGELGPARELDVFMRHVVKRTDANKGGGHGLDAVVDDFRKRRRRAFDRAEEAVGSVRFRRLLLDVMTWIEIGDWTRKQDELTRTLRERSVVDAAAEELRRRDRKIRKRGAKLAELDPRSRHKLRIGAKKLRYACDFFAGAFPNKKSAARRRRFVAKLKDLQDALGDLNDIQVNQELPEAAIHRSSLRKQSRRAAQAFAAGRLSGRESARFDRIMQTAKGAYRKFAKTRSFWR